MNRGKLKALTLFAGMPRSPIAPRILPILAAILTSTSLSAALFPDPAPLEWPEADLSSRLMDGAHLFVERQIQEAKSKRARFWTRDFSSPSAYAASVETNRAHLKTILGAVDPRLPVRMEYHGDEANPALVAETSRYRVFQVRWPVLEELWGSGLLVQPRSAPAAHAIMIPDAGQTPEQLLGLAPGVPLQAQAARRLAENGFELVVLQTITRDPLVTEDPQIRASDQTHREWIYRQAFHMGRHVIGYEVQMVMAALDSLHLRHGADRRIGVIGYAEGGLISFYSAAIDPRIDAALVSGYFDSREQVWAEPIYRNVWSLIREFSDAEIAGLILPRRLVIEHCPVPRITGHKGDWETPHFERVTAELNRIET
jgi:hypothetical protein